MHACSDTCIHTHVCTAYMYSICVLSTVYRNYSHMYCMFDGVYKKVTV